LNISKPIITNVKNPDIIAIMIDVWCNAAISFNPFFKKALSKKLGITQQDIEIIAGGSGRKKRLKLLVDWSLPVLLEKLEI